MIITEPKRKKRLDLHHKCPLCHALIEADSLEHHIRGCLFRLELDPEKKEDREKIKLALHLTKRVFGNEVYLLTKKKVEKWENSPQSGRRKRNSPMPKKGQEYKETHHEIETDPDMHFRDPRKYFEIRVETPARKTLWEIFNTYFTKEFYSIISDVLCQKILDVSQLFFDRLYKRILTLT